MKERVAKVSLKLKKGDFNLIKIALLTCTNIQQEEDEERLSLRDVTTPIILKSDELLWRLDKRKNTKSILLSQLEVYTIYHALELIIQNHDESFGLVQDLRVRLLNLWQKKR